MLRHLCPGCMKHCYLEEARCERGAEYAQTGILPPRKPRPDGASGDRKPNERKMKYLALDRNEKILYSLREMGDMLAGQEESTAEDLLSCLREEDRADFLMLLEKVRHDWIHRAKKAL